MCLVFYDLIPLHISITTAAFTVSFRNRICMIIYGRWLLNIFARLRLGAALSQSVPGRCAASVTRCVHAGWGKPTRLTGRHYVARGENYVPERSVQLIICLRTARGRTRRCTTTHQWPTQFQLPKNHESTLIYHALRGVYISLTAYAAGLAERRCARVPGSPGVRPTSGRHAATTPSTQSLHLISGSNRSAP